MQVNPEDSPPDIYVTWSNSRMTDFENTCLSACSGLVHPSILHPVLLIHSICTVVWGIHGLYFLFFLPTTLHWIFLTFSWSLSISLSLCRLLYLQVVHRTVYFSWWSLFFRQSTLYMVLTLLSANLRNLSGNFPYLIRHQLPSSLSHRGVIWARQAWRFQFPYYKLSVPE